MIRPVDSKGRLLVLAYVREHQVLSRRLLSDLQAEYDELRKKSVDVIAVASGDSSPDYWRELVSKQAIRFPLAFDAEGGLLESMGWKALPVTAVLDSKRNVASTIFLHRASFRRDLWRQLRQAGFPGAGEARQRVARLRRVEARQAALRAMQELVRAGKSEDAVGAIARLRAKYPQRFAIRMQLGEALIELGRPAEAVDDFLAAQGLEPTSLRAQLWLAIAHARNGDDQHAVGVLNRVAEFMPDAWRAYGELGVIQHRRGNLREASRLFRRSVAGGETDLIWATGGAWAGSKAPALDVVDVDGRPGQPTVPASAESGPLPTIVLFWRTDDAASLAVLRQLQAYSTRGGGDRLAVVTVNVDKQRFRDADRVHVREAAQAAGAAFPVWLDADLESFARYDGPAIPLTVLIDPRGVVRKRIVGADLSTLVEPATASAASTPVAVVGGQPTTNAARPRQARSDRYLAMARHLARQGRIAAAVDSVRRALAEAAVPRILSRHNFERIREGIPTNAAVRERILAPAARQGLAEAPVQPGAVALLGRLLAESGQLDEAVNLLAIAARDDPASPGLSTAYGDCLMRMGRSADAMEEFRRVLAGHPEYGPAHAGLGQALAAEGANAEALRELRLAVQLNPHHQRAVALLADVLQSVGRQRDAVEAYQRAYRMRWARAGGRGRQP